MGTKSKDNVARETFDDVVLSLLHGRKVGHEVFARQLGMSGKSLRRYQAGHPPPGSRARDLLHRLIDIGVDAALVNRAADSLRVDRITRLRPAVTALPAARVTDPLVAKAILTNAVAAASDELNVLPSVVRAVASTVLDAMHASGLDLATTRELLKRNDKKK